MEKISLTFDGYWLNSDDLPEVSGIYIVYRCIHNKTETERTVTLKELIYIGESENVNSRVTSHNRLSDWKAELKKGEVLSFSCARVPSTDRERAEAALIYKHQPRLNTQCKNEFSYADTTVTITGKSKFLSSNFTVCKTS